MDWKYESLDPEAQKFLNLHFSGRLGDMGFYAHEQGEDIAHIVLGVFLHKQLKEIGGYVMREPWTFSSRLDDKEVFGYTIKQYLKTDDIWMHPLSSALIMMSGCDVPLGIPESELFKLTNTSKIPFMSFHYAASELHRVKNEDYAYSRSLKIKHSDGCYATDSALRLITHNLNSIDNEVVDVSQINKLRSRKSSEYKSSNIGIVHCVNSYSHFYIVTDHEEENKILSGSLLLHWEQASATCSTMPVLKSNSWPALETYFLNPVTLDVKSYGLV